MHAQAVVVSGFTEYSAWQKKNEIIEFYIRQNFIIGFIKMYKLMQKAWKRKWLNLDGCQAVQKRYIFENISFLSGPF